MARVPQSRISRVDPAVSPEVPPSFGRARTLQSMSEAFAGIAQLARPAAVRDAQTQGAREAVEAVERGDFRARPGLTVRDEAFNEIGSRVYVSRIADGLATEAERLARTMQGNPEGVARALDQYASGLRTGLPDTGAAITVFEENFNRIRSAYIQRAAKEEAAHLGDQDAAAAIDLFDAMGRNMRNLTMAGGSSSDLAASFVEYQDALIAYGPREGFVLNGVAYDADPRRAGLLSVAHIQERLIDTEDEMKALQIRAAYNDAEDKAEFLLSMDERINSGEFDISEKRAKAVVDDLWSDLSRRNTAAAAEERAAADAVRREGERRLTDLYLRMAGLGDGGAPTATEVQRLVVDGFVSAAEARDVIDWIANGAERPDRSEPEAVKFLTNALYLDDGDPRELMGWLASNAGRFSASDFASWMQKLDSNVVGGERGMNEEQRFYQRNLELALKPQGVMADIDDAQRERIAMAMDEYWRRTVIAGEPAKEVADDLLKRGRSTETLFGDTTKALVMPRGAVVGAEGRLDLAATKARLLDLYERRRISDAELRIQTELLIEWERRMRDE